VENITNSTIGRKEEKYFKIKHVKMIVKKCTRLKAFKLHTYIYYAEFKKIPGRLIRGLVLVIPFGCCSSISISIVFDVMM